MLSFHTVVSRGMSARTVPFDITSPSMVIRTVGAPMGPTARKLYRCFISPQQQQRVLLSYIPRRRRPLSHSKSSPFSDFSHSIPSALLWRVRIKDNLRILIRLLSHTSASCEATRKKRGGSREARDSHKQRQVSDLAYICTTDPITRGKWHRGTTARSAFPACLLVTLVSRNLQFTSHQNPLAIGTVPSGH